MKKVLISVLLFVFMTGISLLGSCQNDNTVEKGNTAETEAFFTETRAENEKFIAQTGIWKASEDISLFNVRREVIYQSETEPSYVAWCVLWKDGDGTLKTSFIEADGEQGLWPPSFDYNREGVRCHFKTLVSSDNGKTWSDTGWEEEFDPLWVLNSDHHIRYVTLLSDGTLLRLYPHTRDDKTVSTNRAAYDGSQYYKFYPYSYETVDYSPKNTTVWVSRDNGLNWEMTGLLEKIFVSGYHILKDGSVVGVGNFIDDDGSLTVKPAIVESFDGGKTWGEPYSVFENEDLISSGLFTEEADFIECGDGRLLVVWRGYLKGSRNNIQFYLERGEAGKWRLSGLPADSGTPCYNYPFLYKASDGTIFLFHYHNAIYYSLDEGKTWKSQPFGQSYYGQMTELSPGHLLAVTHDDYDDNMYPHGLDLSICATLFDYQRVQIQEQTDASAPMAIAMTDGEPYDDFHLRVDLRVDGASGVIFGRKNDSYSFVALTLPAKQRGEAYIGCRNDGTYLVCGKCENGKITVVRRQLLSAAGISLSPGDWAQIQVKAEDGIVTAAVRTAESRAFYTVLNESETQGEVGLFTNLSTGAFKALSLDREPKMIRDNWDFGS